MYKTIVVLMFIAISGLSLFAQTAAKDLISASYSAESANNYTLALEKMKALEAQDTTDAFYKLRIGWLLYLSGKYNESLTYYQKSMKLSPCVDAQIGMVNCYLYLGLWNDAISLCKEILTTYPDYTDVLLKAGYAAYMKKEYNQSISFYQKALLVSPYSFEARGYLVAAYYYNGNNTDAKKHYQFLKRYYPASPSVKDFAKILE